MFEIGFSELMLVGIVALLVFGPDKLPGLARNVGLWTGRIKRMIGSVQQDVQRELAKADELTRLLEEQKQIVERHLILDDSKATVPVTGKSADALPGPAPAPIPVVTPHTATVPAETAPQQQALPLVDSSATPPSNEQTRKLG